MGARVRILEFLIANQHEWHFGLDIARESRVGRSSVYLYLGALQEEGLIETRREPNQKHWGKPRPQYRITQTGLRQDAEGEEGVKQSG
jgi:DNA-binding PadR family transcriptional regulator